MPVINGTTVFNSNNLRVNYAPVNYVITGSYLIHHLQAIDNKLNSVSGMQAVPLRIDNNVTYTVNSNTQVLYAIPLDIDGDLVLDGSFIQV